MAAAERMAVNAAITRLMSGSEDGWFEAAKVVTQFGITIASGSEYTSKVTVKDGGGKPANGYAAGVGNVSVEDGKKTTRTESSSGDPVERVGHYKLVHTSHMRAIVFWHYQQSVTWEPDRAAPPDEYYLFYGKDAEPHTFAVPVWEQSEFPLLMRIKYEVLETGMNFYYAFLGSKARVHWEGKMWKCRSFEIINSIRHSPGDVVEKIV